MPSNLAQRNAFVTQTLTAGFLAAQTLFAGCGVLLALRAVSGGIVGPLGTDTILWGTLLVGGFAFLLHRGNQAVAATNVCADRYVGMLPTVGLTTFAIGMLVTGGPWFALLCAVALLVAEEVAVRRFLCPFTSRQARGRRPETAAAIPATTDEESYSPPDEKIWQELVLAEVTAGQRYWRGTLRTQFAAQQRAQQLHVAFCPAFAQKPTVAIEQIDGPPAAVHVEQTLPQGARIEIRLDQEPIDNVEVQVEFIASAQNDIAFIE